MSEMKLTVADSSSPHGNPVDNAVSPWNTVDLALSAWHPVDSAVSAAWNSADSAEPAARDACSELEAKLLLVSDRIKLIEKQLARIEKKKMQLIREVKLALCDV